MKVNENTIDWTLFGLFVLVLAFLVWLGGCTDTFAAGAVRSPKDTQARGSNQAMASVTRVTLPVPGQPSQVVLVTNRSANVIGPPPPVMSNIMVVYQAAVCPGSNRLQYSDDYGKTWTNSLAPPTVNNGQWVTNVFSINTNYPEVLYRAVSFL